MPVFSEGSSFVSYDGGANGVFTIYSLDNETVCGFDSDTGLQLWTTDVTNEELNNDLDRMANYPATDAYGNIYWGGFGGVMHCIRLEDGTELWASPTDQGGDNIWLSYYPLNGRPPAYRPVPPIVADGKVYDTTGSITHEMPVWQGHKLYCWDAYTGEELWSISGQLCPQTITNGILLATNAYDGSLNAFAKGPTATTVTAPMTAMTAGSSVIIQGTVTEQSPRAVGTPAISDEWMAPWMEYLYMDQAMPTDAVGVPVSIDAIDPNGNFVHLGDTTSDNTGFFGYTWTPSKKLAGDYTIIASFAGSDSYYGSQAKTRAVVVKNSGQQQQASAAMTNTGVAAIIAIAGVGLVVALLRRRR
jgi:hypothetical protein